MNAILVIFYISFFAYSLWNNIGFIFIYLCLIGLYYYITQVKLFKDVVNSVRRKVIIGTWGKSYDPQIYSKVKIDISKIEPYLEQKSKETGEKITLTMYAIKLMSIVLKKYPELCGFIKHGKYVNADSVDICCLVAMDDGKGLANSTIRGVENMDLKEISSELKKSVNKIRAKKDKDFSKKMDVVSLLPTCILDPIASFFSYLSSLGLSFKPFGVVKYEYGSCILTSIGSIGLEDGYPPIPPMTYVPILVSVCKKRTKYFYDKDKNIVENIFLPLNFTIDIRFINANIAMKFYNDLKEIGQNPERFEEELTKNNKSKKTN